MKHISEYEVKAINFLADTNTRLEITQIKPIYKWGAYRWQYSCKLRRGHKTYTFPFYDSVKHYIDGERPTKYDILACLDTFDHIDGFQDFINEYGYDCTEEAEKIYRACMKQSEKLHGLFTDEELEELNNIW